MRETDELTRALEIAAEYMPDAPRRELYKVLTQLTGYPCFWLDASASPEVNLRRQLERAAKALHAGTPLKCLAKSFDEDLKSTRGGHLGED